MTQVEDDTGANESLMRSQSARLDQLDQALPGLGGGYRQLLATLDRDDGLPPATRELRELVRYRAKLERNMSWLPAKEAMVRKNCGGGDGGGGGGGGACNVFFRSVPTGATPEGLYATRTVLRVYCESGEKVLEHQNYPASMHLKWSRDSCSASWQCR